MASSAVHLINLYQSELGQLGLTVEATRARLWRSGSYGHIEHNVSFSFRRRDETFSPDLLGFLRTRIGLSDDQIQQLTEVSTYTASEISRGAN